MLAIAVTSRRCGDFLHAPLMQSAMTCANQSATRSLTAWFRRRRISMVSPHPAKTALSHCPRCEGVADGTGQGLAIARKASNSRLRLRWNPVFQTSKLDRCDIMRHPFLHGRITENSASLTGPVLVGQCRKPAINAAGMCLKISAI